jgi:predicted dehydrogenase
MNDNSSLRVAVLGATGRQGRRRADAVTKVPGLAMAQLVDIPEAVAPLEELARKYECAATSDWEAVVRGDLADVVIICTPNSRHAEMALGALAHGKHVLVEKPLADSVENARLVAAEAERKGLALKTGFNVPFRRQLREAFAHFVAGKIGNLLCLRGVISHSQFMSPDAGAKWFCQPGLASHGAWLDLGIHLVDLASRALAVCGDEFATVTAQMAGGRVIVADDLEEECVALYKTRAGRLVSLHASWVELRPFAGSRFELIGDQGRIDIDLGARTTKLFERQSGKVVESLAQFEYVDPDPSWTTELEAFLQMIHDGPAHSRHAESGLAVQEVAFAAYESARNGGRVVPVETT